MTDPRRAPPSTREIFETVKAHLLAQKCRSMAGPDRLPTTFGCAYRGDGGRKCAVGVLIPDALYFQELEGKLADELCNMRPCPLGFNPTPGQLRLLDRLQRLHDSMDPVIWAQRLDKVEAAVNSGEYDDH